MVAISVASEVREFRENRRDIAVLATSPAGTRSWSLFATRSAMYGRRPPAPARPACGKRMGRRALAQHRQAAGAIGRTKTSAKSARQSARPFEIFDAWATMARDQFGRGKGSLRANREVRSHTP